MSTAGGSVEPGTVGVLIVDDEPMIAMALEDILRDLGFRRIYCAGTLEDGRALIATEAPGLGVLDVNVGKTLVFPLAADLRARGVPFFFSSGLGRESFPEEWKSHAFVPKPASARALAAVLQTLGFDIPLERVH